MNKPTKILPIEECYSWLDVQAYIEATHNCSFNDFAGRYRPGNTDAEYQNFWHFLIKACPGISNGSLFYMPGRGSADQVWQNQILDWIWDEFGERAIDGDEFDLPMWVSW